MSDGNDPLEEAYVPTPNEVPPPPPQTSRKTITARIKVDAHLDQTLKELCDTQWIAGNELKAMTTITESKSLLLVEETWAILVFQPR